MGRKAWGRQVAVANPNTQGNSSCGDQSHRDDLNPRENPVNMVISPEEKETDETALEEVSKIKVERQNVSFLSKGYSQNPQPTEMQLSQIAKKEKASCDSTQDTCSPSSPPDNTTTDLQNGLHSGSPSPVLLSDQRVH
ncbi:hypothetical protein E1301_Tti024195 [Triplophysa tibetana]|uniref:Uncharacterized protein n=1 Tax=Triplophysa tibetana TaxID=1572043 RepID=A0A5A9MWG4_9TELE|nr:hypothetical protein E1301_Tti024195 [Triplophysa tibetana]